MKREIALSEIAAVVGAKVYSVSTRFTYVLVWIQWIACADESERKIQWIVLLNLSTQKTMKVEYRLFVELVNKGSLQLGYFEPEVSHDHIITHETLQQLKR